MSALILNGKRLAKQIEQELIPEVQALKEKGIYPKLAVVMVGNDPASAVYVRNKSRACERVGIAYEEIFLDESITQEELLATIQKLNHDTSVHGILLQLPLPKHLNSRLTLDTISRKKDVDGFHSLSVGALITGRNTFIPCTPLGVITLLDRLLPRVDLTGKHAVIVGRSNIVGKPLAHLLLNKNATVTITHSHSHDLASFTKSADILIAAVGRAHMITKDMVKPGAIVIDVGINRNEEGKLCGDVKKDVAEIASAITPVPGGVGPMTIAMLLKNTTQAALYT